MANLAQGHAYVVVEATCIRHVGVYSFLKGHGLCSAQVIALPVAGTVRAFSPVFLYIASIYNELVGGAFIKAGKVATQHYKVCTHGQGQGNVVVVHNTTVRTNRNVNTCFLVILISSLGHFNSCSCLSTANSLLLTSNTDGATANSHLHKVSSIFCQEHKALSVNNVSSTNLYVRTKCIVNVVQSPLLPLRKSFRGIDTQNINPSFQQCRHTLHVISCINSRTHHVAVVFIQQFQWMLLVGSIVLSEYHRNQVSVLGNNRQRVQLVLPDQVICLAQGNAVLSHNQVVELGHVILNMSLWIHLVNSKVTTGNNSQ